MGGETLTFDEAGEPNQDRYVRSWEDRFEKHIQLPRQKAGIPVFDMKEKAAVMDMLRSMLCFEPEKRLSAQVILKCEWMERWALPEFENLEFHDAGLIFPRNSTLERGSIPAGVLLSGPACCVSSSESICDPVCWRASSIRLLNCTP